MSSSCRPRDESGGNGMAGFKVVGDMPLDGFELLSDHSESNEDFQSRISPGLKVS
jgi:hypothetical protein